MSLLEDLWGRLSGPDIDLVLAFAMGAAAALLLTFLGNTLRTIGLAMSVALAWAWRRR